MAPTVEIDNNVLILDTNYTYHVELSPVYGPDGVTFRIACDIYRGIELVAQMNPGGDGKTLILKKSDVVP